VKNEKGWDQVAHWCKLAENEKKARKNEEKALSKESPPGPKQDWPSEGKSNVPQTKFPLPSSPDGRTPQQGNYSGGPNQSLATEDQAKSYLDNQGQSLTQAMAMVHSIGLAVVSLLLLA
jgi:hypothetical protein